MDYVISTAWGIFKLPEEIAHELHLYPYNDSFDVRTNPKLIEWVNGHPYSGLRVLHIPSNATDWRRLDYDGKETVIAVVDGKIINCASG